MRRHLTYPNVMSTLAVFLVLAGGTALAAGLPKNSVTSKTVKNNSLTSADLADGKGVSGADVADGSLTGADLADRSLTGATIADGSLTGADLAPGSVGAGQLAKGAVGAEQLAPGSVNSSAVLNNSLRGADVAAQTLTGADVDASSLQRVAGAQNLLGRSPSTFMSSNIYELEGALQQGKELANGTFEINQGCEQPGDAPLAGGPMSVRFEVPILESSVEGNGHVWHAVVGHGEISDTWRINLICERPHAP